MYAHATPKTLESLKKRISILFPSQFPDTTWTNKLKDNYFIALNKEVEKKFPNTTALEDELEMLVSRVKYYFPEEKKRPVLSHLSTKLF